MEAEIDMTVVNRRKPLHEEFLFHDHSPLESGFSPHARSTLPMTAPTTHLRGSRNVSSRPPPVIYVSHGCLLIPMFMAAWWYWSKSVCRRMVRGFVRATPEPEIPEKFRDKFDVNDSYIHWEDSIGVDNGSSASDRLVKWINRSNVHRRYQRHGLKVKTREYLYGDVPNADAMSNVSADDNADDDSPDHHHNNNVQTSSKWECLPDVGTIQLCSRVRGSAQLSGEVYSSAESKDTNDGDSSMVVAIREKLNPMGENSLVDDHGKPRIRQPDPVPDEVEDSNTATIPALADSMTMT